MAKRTWITVKRGILEPKHRFALGELIWLYMYILDITNWEAGVIEEWSDKGTAEEMDMPVATLVDQRRKLQEKGYVTCERKQHGIRVIVHNWTNPREYTGKKYNEKNPVNTPINTLVNTSIDTPVIKSEPTNVASSYNQKSQIKSQNKEHDLISNFVNISGVSYYPKNILDSNAWNKTLAFLKESGVTNEIMKQACQEMKAQGKTVTDPESIIPACSILLRS